MAIPIDSYPVLKHLGRVVHSHLDELVDTFTEGHSHLFSFQPPFPLGDIVVDPEYFQKGNIKKKFIGKDGEVAQSVLVVDGKCDDGEVAKPVLIVDGIMKFRASDIGYSDNPSIFSIVARHNRYQLQQIDGTYQAQIKLNFSLSLLGKNQKFLVGIYFPLLDVLVLQNETFTFHAGRHTGKNKNTQASVSNPETRSTEEVYDPSSQAADTVIFSTINTPPVNTFQTDTSSTIIIDNSTSETSQLEQVLDPDFMNDDLNDDPMQVCFADDDLFDDQEGPIPGHVNQNNAEEFNLDEEEEMIENEWNIALECVQSGNDIDNLDQPCNQTDQTIQQLEEIDDPISGEAGFCYASQICQFDDQDDDFKKLQEFVDQAFTDGLSQDATHFHLEEF